MFRSNWSTECPRLKCERKWPCMPWIGLRRQTFYPDNTLLSFGNEVRPLREPGSRTVRLGGPNLEMHHDRRDALPYPAATSRKSTTIPKHPEFAAPLRDAATMRVLKRLDGLAHEFERPSAPR